MIHLLLATQRTGINAMNMIKLHILRVIDAAMMIVPGVALQAADETNDADPNVSPAQRTVPSPSSNRRGRALSLSRTRENSKNKEAEADKKREAPKGEVRTRQSVGQTGSQVTNLAKRRQEGATSTGGDRLDVKFTAQANPDVAVLLLAPEMVNVEKGDMFYLRVGLSNPRGVLADRLAVELRYDKLALAPISLDDAGLTPFCASPPSVMVDRRAGTILLQATLASPISKTNMNLISFEWQALRPVESAVVEYGAKTALTRDGSDVLGQPGTPDDGTISARVQIVPPSSLEDEEEDVASYEMDRREIVASLTRDGATSLTLYAPDRAVKVGQDFYVDVWLDNEGHVPIDKIQLRIAFDPQALEVIDDDEGNWILLGDNILDGPFHDNWPFDLHMRNSAFNGLGEIYYGVGMQEPQPLPFVGTFVRIRFRPRKAGPTEVRFVTESSDFATRVCYIGQDILGLLDNPSDGARGCSVMVVD